MPRELDVRARWVAKDPAWEVTCVARHDGRTTTVVATLLPGLLVLAEPILGTDGAPIDAATASWIVEDLAAWAFDAAPVRVDVVAGAGGEDAPLRVRGGAHVDASRLLGAGRLVYRERGRSTDVRAVALVRRGERARAWLLPPRASRWRPSGSEVTPAESARITARLLVDDGVAPVVEPAARAGAASWKLVAEIQEWERVVVGNVPGARHVPDIVAARVEPPAASLFWSAELPTLYVPGVTGWLLHDDGDLLLGPVAPEGLRRARALLDGESLPTSPRLDGAAVEGAETRDLLHAWAVARRAGASVPEHLAARTLGAIVSFGEAALAVYADGRVRYASPRTLVVVDADADPALGEGARALLAAVAASGATDEACAAAEATGLLFGVTRLTLAGPEPTARPETDPAVRVATDLLLTLVERFCPLPVQDLGATPAS